MHTYIYICALFVLGSDSTCDMSYCIVCSFLHCCFVSMHVSHFFSICWQIFGWSLAWCNMLHLIKILMCTKCMLNHWPGSVLWWCIYMLMKWLQDLNGNWYQAFILYILCSFYWPWFYIEVFISLSVQFGHLRPLFCRYSSSWLALQKDGHILHLQRQLEQVGTLPVCQVYFTFFPLAA